MTYAKLLLYWLIVRMSERLFTNDADVNSSFAVSSAHYNYAVTYTAATIFLFYVYQTARQPIRINLFTRIQLVLYGYALVTSIWSPELLVSLGQAVYSFYGIIFSLSLTQFAARDEDPVGALRKLLHLWSALLLIDYAVDIVFFVSAGTLKPPPIDEKALVALATLVLTLVTDGRVITWRGAALFWMFAAGQSFSAIVASTIIFSNYIAGRVGKIIGLVFAVGLAWIVYDALRLVQAGQLSMYGKSWEYILSGSGRFRAWDYLYNEIAASDLASYVFGHGFMSERDFLSRQYLSWAIDTHSSILQALYGVGLLGTTVMIALWLIPFLTSRRYWEKAIPTSFWKTLVGCHAAFIIFGLTSSHYFSRPSVSAIFMTSIFLTMHQYLSRDACVARAQRPYVAASLS
ncbi:hypothetical protein ACMGDM_07900 [Sphingomonas sp. DT-51]|uniref:hypothetical protein n=1 Tax=Sphingomonas sp. DT-51 TaxID=3396165 RepID=UPI003F1B438C